MKKIIIITGLLLLGAMLYANPVTPEKALLDFLYLNPYYNTHDELEELRLDEDFMTESLNRERLLDFLQKFKSKILDKRINNLLEIYG